MREVKPTIFFAVPRIWEKLFSSIVLQMKEATFIGKFLYGMTLKLGKSEKAINKALFRVLAWLTLKNIKAILGLTNTRMAMSGAAPIAPDLLYWLEILGIPIYEVYGQTESSGIATANTPEKKNRGTIGIPMPGTEVKLARDNEILIKGPNVFAGYWRQEQKTKETIIDGWLHTGDTGQWINGEFLQITGRKKDIIITSGGKNISPAEIETEIKCSPFITDAVVIGDQRKYLTSLVMIDYENVERFVQDRNLPFTDFTSLCHLKEVTQLIEKEIVGVNKKFSRVEQIKKFRLIDQKLHPEDEELTATMKLKRNVVASKYRRLIDSMYQSEPLHV